MAQTIRVSVLDEPFVAMGQHDETRGVLGRLTGLTVRLSPARSNGRSARRVHGGPQPVVEYDGDNPDPHEQ